MTSPDATPQPRGPQPAASPELSIIVPAYNEETLLPQTLAAIRAACAAAGCRAELIVADNDSTDATAAIAAAAGAKVVHESHRQIAANRNAGARAATATHLLFVDADTLLTAPLLRAALAALAGGAVGGGALPELDERIPGASGRLIGLWHWFSRRFRWACGAFVFCRRDAFEAVGGFDTRYYCSEEIHLSRALARWGRPRQAPFVILDMAIVTSARKLKWYSTWQIVRIITGLLIPGAMRRRSACDFWYSRPNP